MAAKATFSSKSFKSSLVNNYGIEMFFCISICIFFLISSNTKNNIFINFKYFVIAFSEPGLKIVSKPFESLNKMVISLSELKVYKEKYKFLEDENKILKEKLKKSNFNEVENYRLKKLLNIDQKDYAKKLTARILIDPYKSNDSIFFIDLGKIDGLKINDIVFNEFGMIGRIVELGKYSSKVLTIFDTDSVIPVISQKTKIPFFIKGGSLKLSLKHIDKPFNLEHNELIITTDAAGYFKEGIEVGKVVKSLNSVYVEPFAKISDSIYVNVLAFDFEKLIEW
tara:strand:+ start:159 stop:1001 length:843 start_codon:yes stop_codon:yes gene_type:complete